MTAPKHVGAVLMSIFILFLRQLTGASVGEYTKPVNIFFDKRNQNATIPQQADMTTYCPVSVSVRLPRHKKSFQVADLNMFIEPNVAICFFQTND